MLASTIEIVLWQNKIPTGACARDGLAHSEGTAGRVVYSGEDSEGTAGRVVYSGEDSEGTAGRVVYSGED